MRSKFPAFYRIHQNDILEKFDDCIFMFDASALLDVFRLKKETSEKIFDVIEHYADQVKIPYHVAEEYNKRIHRVLKEQLNNIEQSKKSLKLFCDSFSAKRSMPYISKSSQKLLEKFKSQIDTEYKVQEEYVKSQLLYGEYQNRMADLLDGKVLDSFTKKEIDEIENEGAERYSNCIPPGYMDANKDDNRYGDLINWKEILRFAKTSKKNIIFISNDEKKDWVCKENGMTIGPLYELLKEFYSVIGSNDRFFHIYTLDRFLALVNEKDKTIVSEDVVDEVKGSLENNVLVGPHWVYVPFEVSEAIKNWQNSISKLPDLSQLTEKIQKISSSIPNIKAESLDMYKSQKIDNHNVDYDKKSDMKFEEKKCQSEEDTDSINSESKTKSDLNENN